jgi:hypothetical protein
MCRLGQMHDDEGNSSCQTGSEPLQTWFRILLKVELEDGCDYHANQTAEEMTEDEGAWLRQWYVNSSIAKNCRSTLLKSAYDYRSRAVI